MQPEDLSVKERAVLFALLGEARELSNPQLEERVGFRLTGKERRTLNDRKLVESRRAGQTYVHELSDAGWRWCAMELSVKPKARATSMERALYALLGWLDRYLAGTEQSLADVFGWDPGAASWTRPDADIDERIAAAYRGLATGPGEYVKIRELRARLAGTPRNDLDLALERLYRERRVDLVPQSSQQSLTDADRESALVIGEERKHLISIRQA
jgi:hypothetical protein